MQIDEVRIFKGGRGFKILWSDKKVGFGELTFHKVDGEFELDSEFMGDKFCKKIFNLFVDKYLPEKFKQKK